MPGWASKKPRIDPDIAVHDPGQLLDHLQAGDVTLQLGDAGQHLIAEAPVDLPEVAFLHLDAVLQIRRHAVAHRQVLREHAVHDVAADGHVEAGEHLGGLAGVDEDHLLGDQHEEERGLLPVGEDAGGRVDPLPDVLQLAQDQVLLELLVAPDPRRHLLVLPHLLAEVGDLADPLVVHLGHRQVVEGVAEGDQVVDVVVVVALDDDVDDRVEDRALLHRRLGAGGLDVVLDLVGHLVQRVHVEDLLADLVLVVLDAAVGVDLLRPQVVDDLDRPLAEDVPLEDVGEARLGVHGEHQHLVPPPCQPPGGGRREGGLPEPALAAEHDVAPFGVAREHLGEGGARLGGGHRLRRSRR
jgi:hypothetical protein